MTQYRLTFHKPLGNPVITGLYGYALMATQTSEVVKRSIKAANKQQAFRIAQSIAKKNAWAVSGEPVKVS
jgi:hypothetical protein